jgi:hypothetical protein
MWTDFDNLPESIKRGLREYWGDSFDAATRWNLLDADEQLEILSRLENVE